MSQVDEYTIPGSPLTMAALAARLEEIFAAIGSANREATAPDNPFEGMFWWDTSGDPVEVLKRYTVAAGWVSLLSVNKTTGAFTIVGGAMTAAANEFTASQKFKGDALILRLLDTGASGKEWGFRSDGGNLEICENTGTEGSPTWTPRKTIISGTSDAAGLPRSYLAGLGLSNAADTDHDITIAVGTCRDSSSAYDLTLASAITKQIDAAWAAGTNAGGLFSGSVGATTWYHVFLIRKDADGSVDAGFDTSITAANKPAGYTAYRRIGSVKTDGSANIIQFVQEGDYFRWKSAVRDVNTTNPGTSQELRTYSVPLGVKVRAMIQVQVGSSSNNLHAYLHDPDATDEAAGYLSPSSVYAATNGQLGVAELLVRTNTASQIASRFSVSGAGDVFCAHTLGWYDRRGRDE